MARQPGSTSGAKGHLQLIMEREKSLELRKHLKRLCPGANGWCRRRSYLAFDSLPGEVGRLLVEVPQRVSRGKEYRFTVENAREAALTYISARNPELAKQAVDAPMPPQP